MRPSARVPRLARAVALFAALALGGPLLWAGAPADPVRWRTGAPGVEWAELAFDGAPIPLRVVVARVDPRRVRLSLDAAREGRRGTWTVDRAAGDRGAAVALNAGQFGGAVPWGWVVHRGREVRPPGAGALAPAVVVDTAGAVRL
ncbi:hypothetical protein, partial [Roseisolibacter sp. H3M3-2]|uniref:hypothetical protein n=1 Tax=Roseisolibacter sp. H3M3-2 TaxID=3031323 RepID=UPI0023DCE44C